MGERTVNHILDKRLIYIYITNSYNSITTIQKQSNLIYLSINKESK
jgi:hypothetical protein